MRNRSTILAGLLVLSLSAPIAAHDINNRSTEITVPVNGGWDSRAACDASFADGDWVFTVVFATGISKANIQGYRGAHPTKRDGEFRTCSSCPLDPPLEQQICAGGCPSSIQSVGSVTINKPKAGNTGSLGLAAGPLCWRVATGKGRVTVRADHP